MFEDVLKVKVIFANQSGDTMKKLALILVFIPVILAAQKSDPSVAISYNFLLLDDPSLEKAAYEYRPGQSAAFTKLYYPEMKKYSETFIKYIEQMRSVKNYIGPLGTGTPTSLGDLDFKTAIGKIKRGELEKIGNLYFDPAVFEAEVKYNGNDIIDKTNHVHIVDEVFLQKDTAYVEDLVTGEMKRVVVDLDQDGYKVMAGAGFIEEWEFDKSRGNFSKEIKYLSASKAVFDELNGDYRGLKPLFAFKAGKFNTRNIGELRLVREDIEYNVLFNRDFNYAFESGEMDGMVLTSDAGGYIEPSARYQFIISIVDAVSSGLLKVYDYDGINFKLKKATPLTRDDFFDRMSMKETVYTEDLITGEMVKVEVETETQLSDIIGIRFFEDWYMDYANMSMYKRVKGLVLLTEKKDMETGEAKGAAPVNNTYISLNPKF
ncbi:MAG: hypothetical protein Salg2KO_09690 [Salibacteraceae bacterium]